MKILVLNSGSSSVKFQLINTEDSTTMATGLIEKIGSDDAIFNFKSGNCEKAKTVMPVKNHDEAIKLVFDSLLDAHKGALKSMDEIGGIGHRVVHGGEKFNESCLIDDDVIEAIKRFSKFAPLHNPHNLKGIEVCKKLLPDTPQVAVFDTSFHSHMPPEAFMYAIPYNEYIDNGIRRFGFHGTSHYYVSKKASEILDIPLDELKMITCHLGNGASMAAVQYGVSVDTTMGFTPLEGLIMGTRSGDIDPAIIMYIMDNENLSTKEVDNLLNKKSGLIGVSEISNDMREIEEKAKQGNKKASLALNMFTRRIKKYIGAYTALMGGLDVIVFTAGIGENSSVIRAKSLEGLEFLGVFIDKDKNASNETIISIGRVNVMVIPTNEELVIAVDTRNIIERQEKIKAQRTTL